MKTEEFINPKIRNKVIAKRLELEKFLEKERKETKKKVNDFLKRNPGLFQELKKWVDGSAIDNYCLAKSFLYAHMIINYLAKLSIGELSDKYIRLLESLDELIDTESLRKEVLDFDIDIFKNTFYLDEILALNRDDILLFVAFVFDETKVGERTKKEEIEINEEEAEEEE